MLEKHWGPAPLRLRVQGQELPSAETQAHKNLTTKEL